MNYEEVEVEALSAEMQITTYYTILGYTVELEQGGLSTELTRGGNHPNCSESRILPYELGQPVDMVRPVNLTTIKRYATTAHKEAVAQYPTAKDRGVSHDRDGQDEEMAMLGRSDKMRPRPRLQFQLEQLQYMARTWPEYADPEKIQSLRLKLAAGKP
jgi:hypothetical protein